MLCYVFLCSSDTNQTGTHVSAKTSTKEDSLMMKTKRRVPGESLLEPVLLSGDR